MYYILKFYDENDTLVHTSIEDDIFSVSLDAQKISSVDFYKTESQNTKILLDGDSSKWYYQNIYTNPLMMESIWGGISEKYLKYKVQILINTEAIYTGWIKLDSIKYNKKNEEISFTLYNSIGLIFSAKDSYNGLTTTEFTISEFIEAIVLTLSELYNRLNISVDSSLYSPQTGYVYEPPDNDIDDYDYSNWGDEIYSWLNLYDNGTDLFLDATKYDYEITTFQTGGQQWSYNLAYTNTLIQTKISGILILYRNTSDLDSGSVIISGFDSEETAQAAAEAAAPDYLNIPGQYQIQNTQHEFGDGTYTVFDYIRFDGTIVLENIILNEDIISTGDNVATYKDLLEALLLTANIALISLPNGNVKIANKFIYDTTYSDIVIDEEELFKYDASYILRSIPNYSKITDMFNFTDEFIISLQTWYKNKFNEIPENLSIEIDLGATQYNVFQKLIIFGRDWQINSLKKDYRNETVSIDLWG